jgi:hypothetical protein
LINPGFKALFLGFRCQVSGVRVKGETGVNQRRWQLAEETAVYGVNDELFHQGWPITTEHAS